MSFCSNCGAVIGRGEISCHKCGTKVDVVEMTHSLIFEAERRRQEIAEIKHHEVWSIAVCVFGLIITIIGLVIGLIERTGVEQDIWGSHIYQYHPYRNAAWVMTIGGNLLVAIATIVGLLHCNKNRRLLKRLQNRNGCSKGIGE